MSWFLIIVFGGLVTFVIIHNVPVRPSADDRKYARKILSTAGLAEIRDFAECSSFREEIEVLTAVQRAVLSVSLKSEGIPKGRSRGPRDIFELKQGLCYDRSYVNEKIFTILGFKNRHAALFSVGGREWKWRSLFAIGTPSHHVTEVLTRRGWVVVDSNSMWIGVSGDDRSIGLFELRALNPQDRKVDGADPLLGTNFIYVLGLYARHGHFFWPYDWFPDLNIFQFIRGLPPLVRQLL